MTDSPLVLAIDQGTSSTKVVLVEPDGSIARVASAALGQRHPRPGWVEQDAVDVLASVRSAVADATRDVGARVAAIGVSSQRESALVWERSTGEPLGPMLGWQDRRTADAARSLAAEAGRVEAITGLPLDPMFSALKLAWLLDEVDPDRSRSARGELCLGTVDSWLVASLTGEHRIELGNASRTQLLDLRSTDWSDELCALFRIPRAALPRIVHSDEPTGAVTTLDGVPTGTRITGVLGDSHAALYGHGVRAPGPVKVTYGTGSSVMGLTPTVAADAPGLARTIAWATGGEVAFALEGNILSAGSTLVWFADVLGCSVDALVDLATSVESSGGVDLVPAFAGLGAPWWDASAHAIMTGMSLGTGRGELARAAVESVVLQVEDVVAAVERSAGTVGTILADGGPSANRTLMQWQADASRREVRPSVVAELSALGAGMLASTSAGVSDALVANAAPIEAIHPSTTPEAAAARLARWHSAVARSRGANGTAMQGSMT